MDEFDKVIEELFVLRKKRVKARVITGLLVLISSLLPVSYIMIQGYRFFNGDKVRVMQTLAATKTLHVAKKHLPELKDASKRIAAEYITNFQRIAERDYPVMEPRLYQELGEVVSYASDKWDYLEGRVDHLLAKQKIALIDNFSKHIKVDLTTEEKERLFNRYVGVITSRIGYHFDRIYQDHLPVVKKLDGSLVKLVSSEPDLDRPISPNEAFGLALEFLGVELQSSAYSGYHSASR